MKGTTKRRRVVLHDDAQSTRLPFDKVHTLECCDCGLVHTLRIRPWGDGFELRMGRDEIATKKARAERERRMSR